MHLLKEIEPVDLEKAFHLFSLSAAQGSGAAFSNLGLMYIRGNRTGQTRFSVS